MLSLTFKRWRPGEEREIAKMTEAIAEETLTAFVTAEKLPLSLEFSKDNSQTIFGAGIPKHVGAWGSCTAVFAG